MDSSAISRALAFLEVVSKSERPVSLSDLVEALDLPKATVHRIALELSKEGMLLREPEGKRFSIGPRFTSMALVSLINSPQRGARREIMQRLVDEIGETCNFTVLDGNQVVYVDRVEAHWPLKLYLQPGSHVPLHCTASGKLFLSMLRASLRRKLVSKLKLVAHTPNTITDPARLTRALEVIRKNRVGTDNEEFLSGLVAVAVPVMNGKDNICGALAVHGPTSRLNFEHALQQVPKLNAAAAEMTKILTDN